MLVCLALLVSWVRGYWRFDTVTAGSNYTGISVGSRRGVLWLSIGPASFSQWRHLAYDSGVSSELEAAAWNYFRANAEWDIFGVYLVTSANQQHKLIAIPTLFLAFGFLVPPAAWFFLTASQRRRADSCVICSYNLSGNISGICPECGRPIKHL
jgi:hypothetical protein